MNELTIIMGYRYRINRLYIELAPDLWKKQIWVYQYPEYPYQ